jgi:23S rRNA (cytosine1962-C5)-methyltransferase
VGGIISSSTTAATLTLAKELARSLRRGHPWVYRDALRAPPGGLPSGALVRVRDRGGRPLVWGFWDARSPIAVRVLGVGAPAHAEELVRERLAAALARRRAGLGPDTNAFRWVHGEGDQLPGIHVDLYDDVVTVRYDGAGARAFYRTLPALLEATAAPLRLRAVVDRERRSQPSRESLEVEVVENGLRFGVDLARGQKGGLFLDQRENRAEVGRRARGKSVLNLFGYTGGFSLYAAAGGALRTDTVDSAAPALEAARSNFARNGLPLSAAGFHAADAFAFLEEAARRKQRWDIVISDPPSFAPSRGAVPAARRAYRRLHALAARVVAPGGLFCPASCSSHFPRQEFLASVTEGVARAGRRWHLEALRGAGFDHPVLEIFPEGDYLKFALGRVD